MGDCVCVWERERDWEGGEEEEEKEKERKKEMEERKEEEREEGEVKEGGRRGENMIVTTMSWGLVFHLKCWYILVYN